MANVIHILTLVENDRILIVDFIIYKNKNSLASNLMT